MQRKKPIDSVVKSFQFLLEKYPDEIEHAYAYVRFLIFLVRLNDSDLPLIEIVTVVREERPQIFDQIKVEARNNLFLELATELEMDYLEAKEKLEGIFR